MKTFIIWSIIFVFFISCNEDSDTIAVVAKYSPKSNVKNFKISTYPANSANFYDYAGKLHYDICESYLNQSQIPTGSAATINLVELLASLNNEFQTIMTLNYLSPSYERIDSILASQELEYDIINASSSLSSRSKKSIAGFFTKVQSYTGNIETEYDLIYTYIISFENAIIADDDYSVHDKRILLSATSIARYSYYFSKRNKRKPRDRDWDISWGHLIATIEGGEESIAKAVVMSAVCGIITNNNL